MQSEHLALQSSYENLLYEAKHTLSMLSNN